MRQPDSRIMSLEALKELGCGLITVLIFMLPLLAFSLAARGPAFFFRTLLILGVFLLLVLAFRRFGRFLSRYRRLSRNDRS